MIVFDIEGFIIKTVIIKDLVLRVVNVDEDEIDIKIALIS